MAKVISRGRHWCLLAERGAVRSLMLVIGFLLVVVGLALGVTMIMLPAGLAVGLLGVGLVVWGFVGDLPMDS